MKKRVLNIFLAVLLVGVFLVNFCSAWSDNGSAFQNVDDCGTLSTAGATYFLNQSVSTSGTCFTITADNIFLDLNGYGITGDNLFADYGVYANGRNNITVRNGTIQAMGYITIDGKGLYFSGVNNSLISYISLTLNGYGAHFESSNNITLTNSTINSNKRQGVYVFQGSNNYFYGNLINSNGYSASVGGLYLQSSLNSNITNNTALYNKVYGLFLDSGSNNTKIVSNNFGNSTYALSISSSINNDVFANNLSNATYGAYLSLSSGNNVSENFIFDNRYGLLICPSSNNSGTRNFLSNNVYGVSNCPSLVRTFLTTTNPLINNTNQDLVCYANATDADADNLTYSGSWYRNSSLYVGSFWNKSYDGGSIDAVQDIAVDSSGNVYVTGYTTGANVNYYTIKYASNGTVLWSKTYNGASNGADYAGGIAVDNLGNVYVTGYSRVGANDNPYTIKYNSTGDVVWAVTENYGAQDRGRDVALDSQGNIYVVGDSSNAGGMFLTIKYLSNGTRVWFQTYYPGAAASGRSIATDTQGNVYIAGQNGSDFFVFRYNSSLSIDWTYDYSAGTASAYGISVDPSNNIYATGRTTAANADYYTIKFDKFLNTLWSKSYNSGSIDTAFAISSDSFGNSYVTGFATASTNFYTIKYDSNGNVVWNQTYDSGGADYGYAITSDSVGNVYVGGLASNNYYTLKYNGGSISVNNSPSSDVIVGTLESRFLSSGDNWTCSASVFDGLVFGSTSLISNGVSILGLANVTAVLAINQSNILGGNVSIGDSVTINATVVGGVASASLTVWQNTVGGAAISTQSLQNFIANNWTTTLSTNGSFSLGSVNYTVYATDGSSTSNRSGTFNLIQGPRIYSCGVLAQPNTIYTLQNGIFSPSANCFNITADNVTLNGNGYTVSGVNGNTLDKYAVYANSVKNLTVKNLTIDSFGENFCVGFACGAVYLFNVNSSNIANVNFINNENYPLFLSYSNNNTLQNVTFISNVNYPELYSSSNNTLRNITSNTGLYFVNSNNNFLQSSNCSGSGSSFGITGSSYNIIFSNLFNDCSIGLDDSVSIYNIFDSNNITGTTGGFEGVSIIGASVVNNTFLNNNIWNNEGGSILVYFPPTRNYLIYNNSFGQVKWIGNQNDLSIAGDLTFPGNIQISSNSAFLNSTALSALNVSANITFYDSSFAYPKLLKDGVVCSAPRCNLLISSGNNHTFNVSSWSNYTLVENTDVTFCRDLAQANTLYTLQNDIYGIIGNCFNISADNIVLDGNGKAISGDSLNSDGGITVENRHNITIKNFKNISNFGDENFGGYGLALASSFDCNITNISLYKNSNSMIAVYHSNNNTFSNIVSANSPGYASGLTLYNSSSNSVYNFVSFNCSSGMAIYDGKNNYLSNISLYNNSFGLDLFDSFDVSDNNSFENMNSFNNSLSQLRDSTAGTNSLFYTAPYGGIFFINSSFLENMNIGNNIIFPGNIQISNNSAYVNSFAMSELNVSANVTLNLTGFGINTPRILKDGNACSSPDCNVLSYSNEVIVFNVSSWSNYTIQDISDLTSCGVLDVPNTIYTLQNNVSTDEVCFNISANNITLDLNGYNVSGEEVGSYGIYIKNTNITTLKNGKIINFTNAGVFMESSFYSNITNLTLENNDAGIKLSSSNSNSFSYLAAVRNNFYGLAFYISPANNIFDSINLSENFNGLQVLSSGRNNTLVNFNSTNNLNADFSYFSSGLSPPPAGTYFNTSLSFIDSVIWSYSIQSNTQKLISFEKSNYGKISFLDQVSGSGTNLSEDIQISNNSIYVNSVLTFGLNKSANITFYGLPTKVSEMYNASVLFNEGNGKMSCSNCNLLNSSDSDSSVTFNVSDFGNSRNYSVGGVDVIALNSGWNSVSFIMDGLTNSSKNISVSAGWNLIGLSGESDVNVDDLNFTNNSGNSYSWSNAVSAGKVMNDVLIYNSILKTFEITINLTKGKSYWVYAREAGNLSLPSMTSSRSNIGYNVSNFMFSNGSIALNITEAVLNNWIADDGYFFKRTNEGWRAICSNPDGVVCNSSLYFSNQGIFLRSLSSNLNVFRI